MVAHPQPPRWTVEAYLEMERGSPIRHEYLDGYVYAMAGGTRNHSRISVNVTSVLNSLVGDGPCQVFNSDMKVRVDARNYVYPDASVSCDPRDTVDGEADSISFPMLVVEVLSDESTAAYDRGDKFNVLYKRLAPLCEYVLVDAGAIAVEVRLRGADGGWESRSYGPGDTIPLRSLGAAPPVATFYARIML
jgi:Uma2 family endonuclease